MYASAAFGCGLCHNVYRPEQRRCAEDAPGRAFYYLYSFNVSDVYGHVEGVMTGLWVADVYAVEQYRYMLACAAPDAYVCLRSYCSALADIHSCGVFQQVVYTLCRRGGNLLASQHSYNSRCAAGGQRCA